MFGIVDGCYSLCERVSPCPRQLMHELIELRTVVRQIPSAHFDLTNRTATPVRIIFAFQPPNGIDMPTLKFGSQGLIAGLPKASLYLDELPDTFACAFVTDNKGRLFQFHVCWTDQQP